MFPLGVKSWNLVEDKYENFKILEQFVTKHLANGSIQFYLKSQFIILISEDFLQTLFIYIIYLCLH